MTVPLKTARGRWIVAATVLGSSLAMLDATVVNIALPDIGTDLDAQVQGLQWTLSGYTLTLAAFILLGGSLGDRFGRRRIFVLGTVWFTAASLLCGLAPNIDILIAARVLQGVGAALLTPGSLALISASIDPEDRGAAIGLWSGLGGVASAAGPLLGGWLVEIAGWRTVFLINVPLAIAVVFVAARHVPESLDPHAPRKLDFAGAAVGAVALAGLTYGLIETLLAPAVVGLIALVLFVWLERRSDHPLVPPTLFSSRVFVAANLVTFAVYAALGGVFFLLLLQLQIVVGFSPLAAGLSTLPITALMLVLSSRAGAIASRIGPRLPLTIGPLVAAVGLVLMTRIGSGGSYVGTVLPAVVVFGLGLSILVAPLTTAVLAAAPAEHAGTASGVNNAVARTSQLLAVAALPALAGIAGVDYDRPNVFDAGFTVSMLICAGLLLIGAAIAAIMIRSPRPVTASGAHCDVGGPPLTR